MFLDQHKEAYRGWVLDMFYHACKGKVRPITCHSKHKRESGGISPPMLNLFAGCGGGWSKLGPGPFITGEGPRYPFRSCWLGPRAGLVSLKKEKSLMCGHTLFTCVWLNATVQLGILFHHLSKWKVGKQNTRNCKKACKWGIRFCELSLIVRLVLFSDVSEQPVNPSLTVSLDYLILEE
jgi:hypothetical protein